MWDNGLPPALKVEWLQLADDDLRVARIIAEETEAQRLRELSSIPEPTDADEQVATGLLGLPVSVNEQRRRDVQGAGWDQLLKRGPTLLAASERSGLDPVALCDFALYKCVPRNWESLYWFRNWLREASADKISLDQYQESLISRVKLARAEGLREAGAKGGAAKGKSYQTAREYVAREWSEHGGDWDSKTKFAEAYVDVVSREFRVTVAMTTIRDEWLPRTRNRAKSE